MPSSARIARILPAVLFAVLLLAAPARAQVGIGIHLGEPTGLNLRVGQNKTLDFTLGWDLNENGDRIIGMGNYLIHTSPVLREIPVRAIVPFVGIGLGVWVHNSSGMWVQVPLGVDFRFSVPLELSVGIYPGMDIIPETEPTVHWGIGLRYWLK